MNTRWRQAAWTVRTAIFVVATSAALLACHPSIPVGEKSSGLTITVNATNAMYKVQKTNPDQYYIFPNNQVSLSAAKNEFEAFQIVVPGSQTNVNATATSLSCSSGACSGSSISAASCSGGVGTGGNIRLYRERYYGTNITSSNWSDQYSMLGTLPDALIPQVDEFYNECRNFQFSVNSGENGVIWVDIYVPQNQTAGVYTGNVTVTSDGGSATVPVTLQVWDFQLPSTASLKSFYNLSGNAIQAEHGVTVGTQASIDLFTLYGAAGLDHRITLNAINEGNNYDPSYLASTFGSLFNGTLSTAPKITRLPGAKTTSIEYQQNLTDTTALSNWYTTMNNNGWAGQLLDYMCDEVYCTSSTVATNGQDAHGANANFRTLATLPIATAYSNGVDYNRDINLFVAEITSLDAPADYGGNTRWQYNDYPQGSGSDWETYQSTNEVWTYQSCATHGCDCAEPCGTTDTWRYPSLMIDARPMRNRALEWHSFKNRIKGELYYDVNYSWSGGAEWDNQWAYSGHGDGTLMYPGTPSAVAGGSQEAIGGTHDIPITSIRMKLIREGMEDYEYMNILANQGYRTYAENVYSQLFPNGAQDSEADPQLMYDLRSQLACTILTNLGKSCSSSGYSLSVSRSGTGTGAVTSSPAGIDCGTTCSASFTTGTQVTLTATPSGGSSFAGWSGDCSGTGSCTLTMSAAHSVTATFNTSATCTDSDCFNRADGSLGANWNVVTPTIQIVSDQAEAIDTGTKRAEFLQAVGPNQDISVLCKTTGGSGSNCGLMGRFTDTNNYYYAYMDVGHSHVDLWRVSGGTLTQLGSAQRTISSDTFYPFRLTIEGSSIAVYFNNEVTPTISATDSTITTGDYGGLHTYANSANSVMWEDFNIVDACGVSDCFDRPDGSLGSGWTVTSGAISIVSGQAQAAGTGTARAKYLTTVGTDQDVSANCKTTAGSGSNCGLFVRYTDENDLYYAYMDVGNANVSLWKVVGGNYTLLGQVTKTISSGTSYPLRLVAQGSALSFYFNGEATPSISVSDSDLPTGNYAGLHTYANAANSVTWDNFNLVAASGLFSDDFNRTTGLGSNWNIKSGSTFTTDGTYAVSGTPPANGNGNWAAISPTLSTSDYSVSADMIVPAGSLDSGIFARTDHTDAIDEDLYAAEIATDGNINLYRRNGWTWTLLGNAATTITAGTQYNVKLIVSGSNPVHLEAWLDGVQMVTYDDNSASQITTGSPGIVNYDSGVKYNSFRVDPNPALPLFSDNFNRTTGLGSNWNVTIGSFTTDGSMAISGANDQNWARVVPSLGTNDYAVTADLTVPSGSLYSGIVARSYDSLNTDQTLYAAQIATDGHVNLYRRNDWAWTQLGSVATTINAGTSYNLMLLTKGSNPVHLEVWLNGSQQISYDDSSSAQIASGVPGLENFDGNVKYDNFRVDQR